MIHSVPVPDCVLRVTTDPGTTDRDSVVERVTVVAWEVLVANTVWVGLLVQTSAITRLYKEDRRYSRTRYKKLLS
jgi:hypothetical protein